MRNETVKTASVVRGDARGTPLSDSPHRQGRAPRTPQTRLRARQPVDWCPINTLTNIQDDQLAVESLGGYCSACAFFALIFHVYLSGNVRLGRSSVGCQCFAL